VRPSFWGCGGGSSGTVQQILEKFIIMEDVSVTDVTERYVNVLAFAVRDGILTSAGSASLGRSSDFLMRGATMEALCSMDMLPIRGSRHDTAENGTRRMEGDRCGRVRLSSGPVCRAVVRKGDRAAIEPPRSTRARLVSFTKGCYVGQEVVREWIPIARSSAS